MEILGGITDKIEYILVKQRFTNTERLWQEHHKLQIYYGEMQHMLHNTLQMSVPKRQTSGEKHKGEEVGGMKILKGKRGELRAELEWKLREGEGKSFEEVWRNLINCIRRTIVEKAGRTKIIPGNGRLRKLSSIRWMREGDEKMLSVKKEERNIER